MTADDKQPLIRRGKGDKRKEWKQSDKSRRFYDDQSELQALYAFDDETILNGGTGKEEKEEATRLDNVLSRIVLAVNVALLIGKGAATYLTSGSSLSIISTLLDSVVDITSGLAIWYATYAIMHTDIFKYPRGRENLEKMSYIFIGIVMGMANCYIIFQSVTSILQQASPPTITYSSLAILAATILAKAVLWFLCWKRNTNSSLILAVDQRNDVFTNLVAIAGAVLSAYWMPADPTAAILISGYIAYSWFVVVVEQMPPLVGVAATKQEFSRVARVCIQTSPRVRCLDTLLVYHTGEKVRVEVHVVMDPETPSKVVHDEVVEPMQRRLQCLDFVERAFVHADYECDGYDQ